MKSLENQYVHLQKEEIQLTYLFKANQILGNIKQQVAGYIIQQTYLFQRKFNQPYRINITNLANMFSCSPVTVERAIESLKKDDFVSITFPNICINQKDQDLKKVGVINA